MLSHESGLAAEPPGTDWSGPVYQGDPKVTLARPGDIAVMLPPNAQHKYSDLAYQLLGEIVTRVSAVPYDRYVRELILDPLGMSATGFEPLGTPLLSRRAAGYSRRPFSDELDLEPAFPPVWAEGGLWSCVQDLARWISFQLRAYTRPTADSPVLAAASLREMHKPRYLADDDWTSAWGISWCANRHHDVSWIQHSGGLPGFTTSVCFDPRQQVGAIVLHNGTGFTAEVARELAVTACRLAGPALPTVAVPAPAPVQYRPLLGLYARAGLGGGVLSLQWRAGELAFLIPEIPSWQLTLEPTSDTDVFVAGPGSDLAGENVIFRRRNDGHVTSVLLVQATYLRQDHDSRTGRSDQPLCAAHGPDATSNARSARTARPLRLTRDRPRCCVAPRGSPRNTPVGHFKPSRRDQMKSCHSQAVVTRLRLTVGSARYAPIRERGNRDPGPLPRSAARERSRDRRWPARGRAAAPGVPVGLDLPEPDPSSGRR
jgi:hypothetical protein